MRLRLVATSILLAFVAVSAIFIVRGEKRNRAPAAPQAGSDAAAELGGVAEAPLIRSGVIAYYFHGTRRCPTCRKLEAYSQEAIASGFSDDLKDGRLVWRVVNVDMPENEHFVREYSLTTKSVVLVAVNGGREGRWKNLSRIWDLVGDKAAFITYVQGEVKSFQKGG